MLRPWQRWRNTAGHRGAGYCSASRAAETGAQVARTTRHRVGFTGLPKLLYKPALDLSRWCASSINPLVRERPRVQISLAAPFFSPLFQIAQRYQGPDLLSVLHQGDTARLCKWLAPSNIPRLAFTIFDKLLPHLSRSGPRIFQSVLGRK
jgi:hypothetical protein